LPTHHINNLLQFFDGLAILSLFHWTNYDITGPTKILLTSFFIDTINQSTKNR
jgi:hypothetical protein